MIAAPIGRADQESMVEQIEVDLEGSTVVGDQRSAEPARIHVQRNCQEWLVHGVCTSRILPTIWVHM